MFITFLIFFLKNLFNEIVYTHFDRVFPSPNPFKILYTPIPTQFYVLSLSECSEQLCVVQILTPVLQQSMQSMEMKCFLGGSTQQMARIRAEQGLPWL